MKRRNLVALCVVTLTLNQLVYADDDNAAVDQNKSAVGATTWPLLFVFAWSSVMFNLSPVYEWTMAKLFAYQTMEQEFATFAAMQTNLHPRLGWRQEKTKAEQLMAKVAKGQGFRIAGPEGLAYIAQGGVYSWSVRSSRDISEGGWGGAGIWLDDDTGELKKIFLPDGEHTGNTVTNWLRALHFANWHGWLAYRVLACNLGIVVAMLAITGVYIWLKKWTARKSQALRRALEKSFL